MDFGKAKTKRLRIDGMTCVSCQNKIEKKLRNIIGIQSADVSYSGGTAVVAYDPDAISLKDIVAAIQKLGYQVRTGGAQPKSGAARVVGLLVIIVALYVIMDQFGILNLLVPGQLVDTNMGYGMLFVIGLITSVHCVAMCGGINLSQCIPRSGSSEDGNRSVEDSTRSQRLAEGNSRVAVRSYRNGNQAVKGSRTAALRPAFLYNLGRVISYTVVGFIVGALGSAINFSNTAQGILKLIAGVFMVIMGINMLGLFPWLRKLNPRMPKFIARKIDSEKSKSKSPLIVGLLNGLMPCGPLQAMQIYALSTGNPFAGALSMMLFSLGTVPLMFGLGALSSILSKKFTHKVMVVGAVLVVVLGLSMLSQGGTLSGWLSPDLLLPIILGLCAVGIVSSIPFRKLSYKMVSTAVASILVIVAFAAWNIGAASGSTGVENGGSSKVVDGKQLVTSTLSSGSYPDITVQAGTPVKWVIDAPEGSINGCNNRINIPEYGISNYSFKTGENVIEFTPDETGRFQYSCWMGMIRGTITVTEAGAAAAAGTDEPAADNGANEDYTDSDGTYSSDPVPAGYKIPTDSIAVAQETVYEDVYPIQEVTIELTDDGFTPAIVIVKSGLDVQWNIKNSSSATQLLIPGYATQVPLEAGDNSFFFTPADSFDFSTGDNAFYGYIKVVDDIVMTDIEAVKKEVGEFETLIWPPETFQTNASAGGGASGQEAEATVEDGVQYVTSTVSGGGYEPITVQQGIPVKWTLNAPEGSLNGCNNAIVIPEYDLQMDLKTGDNVIEFTPDRSGTFTFSCWMGMVRSTITVVGEDGTVAPTEDDGSDELPSCCG